MKNSDKGFVSGLLTFLVVLVVAVGLYFYQKSQPAFIPIPTTSDSSFAGWESYDDSQTGITFQYPDSFNSNFASLQPSVPDVVVTRDTASIDSNGCFMLRADGVKESKVSVHGTLFCFAQGTLQGSDSGTGELSTIYSYTTKKNDIYVTVNYTVHTPNSCVAYVGQSNYQSCQDFFNNFNSIVIKEIQQSIGTLTFTKYLNVL